MKDELKLILKHIMRFILKIFWIFPIKKNTIFFMSYMGKGILCNPKYIYYSMADDGRFADYTFIWCFKHPENFKNQYFSKNTRIICKRNLFSYFYHLLTSETIIYNCNGFSYAPIRKKQFLIETMHSGGVFKGVGFTVDNKTKASKKGITLANKDIKMYISSAELSTKYYIRDSYHFYGEVLNSGLPRVDLMFHYDQNMVQKVKEDLHVPESKKIVLYAPTFRGREDQAHSITPGSEVIDPKMVKEALTKRFGGEWVFLTRGHQYVNGLSISGSDGDISSYPDMQEILLATDVLITDYSSSPWDFSFLNRPIFLYVSDLTQFDNNDRGLLIPLEKWLGIITRNNEDLYEKIISYSQEDFERKTKEHYAFVQNYDHGNACEILKARILNR
ncbi:MAG: CDP-glycerol glycerophosphotransferase family protein [Clostridiales bacterium]|nr:CDP-glycerol glycerophosphotransferase family protein [Clostridiales bacterium]